MSASGPSQQRPIARRAHKKSKTGCRTCKIRKVKCDERRPLCRNCERHFTNLVACDFDDREPVLDPAVTFDTSQQGTSSSSSQSSGEFPSPSSRALAWRDGLVGRQTEPMSLPKAVGAGRIDPFEARPFSEHPPQAVDALMAHYLSSLAYRSFPFYASKPLIELWWPFVRNDDVLFHVILLLSGLDRDHLESRDYSVYSRTLLDQCLTLLRARVADPVAGINDHTLVAIATLASMEHDRGNIKALDMHLEGLKRIVEMRGGLDAVRRENAMAANVVFWCAMVSINEPNLLPFSYVDNNNTDDWLLNQDTATLHTHDGGEANLGDFGVDVVTANVLHEVQRLSRLYTATLEYGTPQEAVTVLSYLCSILDRLMQLGKTCSEDSPVPGLSQSCRIAGVLHVFAPMSAYFPDPTIMLHTLVRDLKQSLTYMIRALGTQNHLLLWLLCVGGITAHSMPERLWFVGHLVVVVGDLDIHNWDEMRQYLVKLAFHDNFCDISFHALWDEVRSKQEALNLLPSEG